MPSVGPHEGGGWATGSTPIAHQPGVPCLVMKPPVTIFVTLAVGLVAAGCRDGAAAGSDSTSAPSSEATTSSTTSPAATAVDVQASVEATIELVEDFDRHLEIGASSDALSAGTLATAACDELLFEDFPSLPNYDTESGTRDMALHCGMLSAAVLAVQTGETIPNEVDIGEIAEGIRSVWEKHLATN
jgi:hypothetical protein